MNEKWYAQSTADIMDKLKTGELGLSQEEANHRLEKFGSNKLPDARVDSLVVIFLRQFRSPLIYILFAASVALFLLDDIVDALIIMAVLLFNAIIGTVQEGKAQNTLRALKQFAETKATVLRDGRELIVNDYEVVPGDIIIVQEGEKVPADARVIFSHNIKVDEAALTGESGTVDKVAGELTDAKIATQDQTNMLFKGTNVVAGNGKAIVVATGLQTTIGKIAAVIGTIDTEIPLKANIRYLSRIIIAAVGVVCGLLFAWGIWIGRSALEMFTIVVSLAVSIIPEGLPVVITIVLAAGVWRMSKRNALVKRLQAVEALGQARVIAVDKTGTITKNEMVVREVFADDTLYDVTGVGYEPKGSVTLNNRAIDPLKHQGILLIGKVAALSSNARVMFSEDQNEWRVAGDPTEAATLIFSSKIGFHKDDLVNELPLLAEVPFDYKNKFHATVHSSNSHGFVSVVGAPEVVLKMATTLWRGGKPIEMTDDDRKKLNEVVVSMSEKGLRVIAAATTQVDIATANSLTAKNMPELTFIGFYGMKDALRSGVAESLQQATDAGIRVVMITGDHKITAQAIARDAGIFKEGDLILVGQDIDAMSDKALAEKILKTSVFARVTPEHKLRIINAYKARGEVVAMTGDGVNDAPSLVAADLGVAMGKIGTEVAKEASDIVLLDDNFSSIMAAVEEGRNIYKTIKKVILYLFSTSLGELLTIIGAFAVGFPLPILPGQIIWLNFVTDGFLVAALAMEPKEKGLLHGTFKHPKKYVIDGLMTKRMFLMSMVMMVGTLWLFKDYFNGDMTKAWTISLTTLAVFQWFNVWNCRSESESIFKMNPFSNKFLIGATVLVIGLHMAAVYTAVGQAILRTTPLSLAEWGIILAVASSIIVVEEIRKFIFRRRNRD